MSSHCVHQPSASRFSSTASTARIAPSRNENSSLETTAPSSCVAQLRNTARPPSPSAGASTAAGASSRYSKADQSRREQTQREVTRAAGACPARPRRSARSPADPRPGAAARCGTPPGRRRSGRGTRSRCRSDRSPTAAIRVVDRVALCAVGRQSQEHRAVAPRGTQQLGAAFQRSHLRLPGAEQTAERRRAVLAAGRTSSRLRRSPAPRRAGAGPSRTGFATPADVAELQIAPRTFDRRGEHPAHRVGQRAAGPTGVPRAATASVPRPAWLAQPLSAPDRADGIEHHPDPAGHHREHQQRLPRASGRRAGARGRGRRPARRRSRCRSPAAAR